MVGYAVNNDGSGWRAVAGPEDVGEDEWYSLDEPPPPQPTDAQVLARANDERDRLLSIAALRIAPLQDAVDLDEATPAEVALLKKWKQYRVAVNRVEQQPGFPRSIDWPTPPDAV